MKRIVTLVLIMVVVASVAMGGGRPEQAATGVVELDVWSWRTEDVVQYNEIFRVFEAENPNIRVNFRAIRNVDYNTVLATALEGGQGPDVMKLRAYGGLQRFIEFVTPIDGLIDGLDQFSSASLASAKGVEDGRLYGVPFANQVLGVFYNRRIFREQGLSEPNTWEEFISLMQTLRNRGITPLANGGQAAWMLEIVFGAIGPNFYGGNDFFDAVTAGRTTFNDPRFVNALRQMESLRPFFPNGFMGLDHASMQANFFTEQAAMFIGGSFEGAFFQQQNPNLEIGVFPVPAPAGMPTRYIGTWADGSFGVNATSAHPEEAMKLLRFLASPQFGDMFTNMLGQISPIPGVSPDPAQVPVLAQFTANIDRFTTTPYIMLVGFRWDQPNGSELLQNGLQGLMQGTMTAEQVADTVQRGIATWFRPFQN